MLKEIIKHKRAELSGLHLADRMARMAEQVSTMKPVHSLAESIRSAKGMAIVAEIKRRSPSAGRLAGELPVASTVEAYAQAGARAISVLTETAYFGGSTADLTTARQTTALPILRKDFIIEQTQLWESRVIGADAVLLIAATLPPIELSGLHHLARHIGLEVLVEIHDAAELEAALAVEPSIIGINNRDLETFTVDLATSEKLRSLIPQHIICVSESGIRDRDDLRRLTDCGIDAALIGETLVTSADPGGKIHELLGYEDD